MKFPVLWSGLCCTSDGGWGGKCSEILATIYKVSGCTLQSEDIKYSHSLHSRSRVETGQFEAGRYVSNFNLAQEC